MPLPTHYKNPFILSTDKMYRCYDIFKQLTFNDLHIIPLNWIHIREFNPDKPWTKIKQRRVLQADIRYPIIIYESKLDPENTTVKKRYCIFDGNHRATRLLQEGHKAATCFIMKPHVFDGLKIYSREEFMSSTYRTTGCNGCGE
tara:strand:+ start:1973 stop:2404 length:432 start_codon:yes stop_codon:yes gene_type:complete